MEIKESIFWNFIRIVWQHKLVFTISVVSTAILTFIITSLMPKTYKASSTFIVLEEEGAFNLSSIIGDLPFDIGGAGISDVDRYIAYLSSRRIRDILIEEFNLWDEYDAEYIEQVYRSLDENIEVIDNFDGTVTINCYFKRFPEKAAQMADLMYEELYKLVLELNKQNSTNFRIYMENNYNQVIKKLAQYEDSLKQFQKENKILELEAQTEFSFNALAELETQRIKYKIEKDLIEKFVTSDSKKLFDIKTKLEAVNQNINEIHKHGENYILAFDKLPEKSIKYIRLYRDIRIQQKIMEFLLPLYENAKMEEQKKTANIQILDKPFTPEYKVRPKRLLYVIIFVFLVFCIELIYFTVQHTYMANKYQIIDWLKK